MSDFTAARRHMVDGQVRTTDVTDLRVISALLEVPRERFMPPASASLAYLDLDVPLGASRRLLRPMVLAKLIQTAELEATDRVLDVGCATGYSAAVLARIVGQVVALEQDAGLAKAAREALSSQPNVDVVNGALADGWPQGAPYDVVVLEGATEAVPHALCQQLKDGGRLVGVFATTKPPRAMIVTRSHGDFGNRALFDAVVPVLPGLERLPAFVFQA